MPTDHNTTFNGFRIDTQVIDESIIQDTHQVSDGITEHIMRSIMHTREQKVRDALIKLGWTPPGENRTQWLPIESAPKDCGILAFQRLSADLWWIYPAYWGGSSWLMLQLHSDNTEHEARPTHWQPLPPPPTH